MVAGRAITVDALLNRRTLARHLLQRRAHCLFTVKGNRKNLMEDIQLLMGGAMAERPPDFGRKSAKPEHGRPGRRPVRTSTGTTSYVRLPGVGQVFAIRRDVTGARPARGAPGPLSGSPA